MQKDNTTLRQKLAIRRAALQWLQEPPTILETHGGLGAIYRACYSAHAVGMVFETQSVKAEVLARQRPTWAVYESDCTAALAAGVGAWLPINYVDCDPYGEPWPMLAAWFASDRPRARRLVIVVNDGLRQKLRMGGAWSTESLAAAVQHFGNQCHAQYLDVCRWLLNRHCRVAGYTIRQFGGYYCGHAQQMTHWAAQLDQDELPNR